MATPTPQSTASSNSGNANGTADSGLVMPTVLDGDGVILVMTSSRGAGALTGNAPALPSGAFTRVGGSSAGDTTASATCTTQVWVKDSLVAATDSGATISGTAMLSGRFGDGLMTYRGGAFEQCTAVNQTTTAANPADAGITPTAADCLRVIVSGYDPASGSSTALTPPASPGTWTERLEAENTASTTFRPGAYFATTPLTGQAGSAQSAATITATTKPNANTYAVTIAPSAATNFNGTSAVALTDTVTSAGQVGAATGSTVPLTDTVTSAGFVGTFAGAALALAVGITAAGVVGTSTGASVPLVATVTSSGVVAKSTGSSIPLVDTITSAGQVGTSSGSTISLTATITAAGSVAGSGLSTGSSIPVTDTVTSAGVVGAQTGASVPLTDTVASTGAVGKQSGASLSETATVASAGSVGTQAGAALTESVGVTAAGRVGLSSSSAVSLVVSVTAAGSVGGALGPPELVKVQVIPRSVDADMVARTVRARPATRAVDATEIARTVRAQPITRTVEEST